MAPDSLVNSTYASDNGKSTGVQKNHKSKPTTKSPCHARDFMLRYGNNLEHVAFCDAQATKLVMRILRRSGKKCGGQISFELGQLRRTAPMH